jgi:molybdopterin molybdotransferase
MISFAQAQDNLHQLCRTWLATHPDMSEPLALSESLGRYLTEDVIAALELPRSDVSAMDGYAVCSQDREGALTSQVFTLKGESRAGEPYGGDPLAPGECVRIFTGAVVPESADTVVIQENVERDNGSVRMLYDTLFGANIRRRGEEIAAKSVIATAGQLITPNMIPLLASQGIAEVKVRVKLRVAFFATGDELKAAGDSLGEGDIYESNLASIAAVLRHYPIDLINLGVVEDTPEAIKACLAKASDDADVVISSGGVSVGDYDYVRQCVDAMGVVSDYKVTMKPGKPVCFGHIHSVEKGKALFFGLPGNAVSSFVVLTELYLPVLKYLLNRERVIPNMQLEAILETDLSRRGGRLEFQRGVLSQDEGTTGRPSLRVSAMGSQDSHRVLGLARANCTIKIAADVEHISAGSKVTVSVFPWTDLQ